MNWKLYTLIALVAGLIILLAFWRIDNVQGQLTLEKAEHSQTKVALAEAIEKGNGWKAAYEDVLNSTAAQKEAVQACLDREVEARAAEKERSAILQRATPHPRTETEQKQVVDDETRKRTAGRLNRPL